VGLKGSCSHNDAAKAYPPQLDTLAMNEESKEVSIRLPDYKLFRVTIYIEVIQPNHNPNPNWREG